MSGRASRETASAALWRRAACRSCLASSMSRAIWAGAKDSTEGDVSSEGTSGNVRTLCSVTAPDDGTGQGVWLGGAEAFSEAEGAGTAASPSGKGNQSDGGKAMPQKLPVTSSSTPT